MYDTTNISMFCETNDSNETTDGYSNPKPSVNSSIPSMSGRSDKLSLRLSTRFGNRPGKRMSCTNSEVGCSLEGLKDCMATFFSLVLFLCLCVVIVLWILALIIDGPGSMQGCVVVWPLMAGVLGVAFLYILLRCVVYCLPEESSEDGIEEGIMINMDSMTTEGEAIPEYEADTKHVLLKQHYCIKLSYGFLILALLCIMIASVVQFFSLKHKCYRGFKKKMEEVVLGYEILVYMSVVILSTLGCFITCFFIAIVITCCNRDRLSSTV